MNDEEFRLQIEELRKWFPAEDHDKRKLPGGSEWWFIPWQKIRQRFDDAFGGSWSDEYSDPYYLLDPTGNHEKSLCVVKCTIRIGDRSRQGVGQAPLVIVSSSGKDASRGTPVERAIADAFKVAAESWGVARYLDDQTDNKKKAAFFRYLTAHGNSKPEAQFRKELGTVPSRKTPKPKPSEDTGLMDAIAAAPPISDSKRRFADLREWTGLKTPDIRAIASAQGLPQKSDDYSDQQAIALRNEMFIQWAIAQGVFSNEFHARNSFLKLVNEKPDMGDRELWESWVKKVGSKSVEESA